MSPLRWVRALTGAALMLGLAAAPSSFARKRPAEVPPATSGLIDNVNGIAPAKNGGVERFSGLLISGDGRVERRLGVGEPRPERLLFRLDAKGQTLIPSFIAPHVRLMAAGIALMTLDLSETRSLADAQAKIADYARANTGRKWILGQGWDAARWSGTSAVPARLPFASDLDAASPSTPTFLVSADGELGWANSVAFKLAGISPDRAIASPMAGDAMQKVARVAPAPLPKDRDIAFDKVQRRYIALGYSTVTDMGTTIDDWQSYRRAGDRGALRLRIIGYAEGLGHMLTIAGPAPTPWLYDEHLKLNGVHFTLDGTLASGTAWMKGSPSPGPRIEGTRLRNQMSRAAMDGFQLVLSAHGDAAVVEGQMAFAEVAQTYGAGLRSRLETGATIGSDATLPLPPFQALAQIIKTSPDRGFATALAALTTRPGFDAFAEARIGALEEGQWADFLLIDRDISVQSPDDIAETRIAEQWIAGKRAWRRDDP
ncbi:MAG: amidohydrolase family protein [Sphingobium sp.]|nr:amidohydrolase family protein [Sphingobium sp.]MCI1271251.1 amidohydrolase family protein [Sphingobium sp.]MCI1756057.1 amidohydrolase family protein [Sphingobium sp.]MCI2052632.1 amidohydrolase family protein [Sphingobium sp.]